MKTTLDLNDQLLANYRPGAIMPHRRLTAGGEYPGNAAGWNRSIRPSAVDRPRCERFHKILAAETPRGT
jgi:hypothetical protein